MKSIYDQFATNSNWEQQGITLEYGDARFRVARAGGSNKAFQRSLESKTRKYRRAIQTDNFPPDQANAIMREVYAETVVLGWENVFDRQGNAITFSKENCIKLFNDLPDLFQDIMDQAGKAMLFREDVNEKSSGN